MLTISIQSIVAFIGTGLLILLIACMYWRGLRKAFPCFFLYLFVVLFNSEALLLIKSFSLVVHFYELCIRHRPGLWPLRIIPARQHLGSRICRDLGKSGLRVRDHARI